MLKFDLEVQSNKRKSRNFLLFLLVSKHPIVSMLSDHFIFGDSLRNVHPLQYEYNKSGNRHLNGLNMFVYFVVYYETNDINTTKNIKKVNNMLSVITFYGSV